MNFFAEEMKRQLRALIFLVVSATDAGAEETIQYSKPFEGKEYPDIVEDEQSGRGDGDMPVS